MKTRNIFILILSFLMGIAVQAQESSLKNITKLTSGGDNAEAYWSPDSKSLTMQISNPALGANCDQIYMLELGKSSYSTEDLKLISTGMGRTTCSFFLPDGEHILYSSTHEGNKDCPPPQSPFVNGQRVWPIYPEFDIYVADLEGNIVNKLTDTWGYDAEAVISPDGSKILFTSMRSGDMDLWIMDIDGSNPRQLTSTLGYEGGGFFSHDSQKVVFRAYTPETPEEIKAYKEFIGMNLVPLSRMEIFTINVDGSDLKQITHLGNANWAPYFLPDDSGIIFSSNHHAPNGFDFQLFTIDLNGENLRQITYESEFNSFPMFSPDGKKLAFASNRDGSRPRETNVFVADWVYPDPAENVVQENLKNTVSYLSSDELEGRLSGSKGQDLAADYLEKNLKALGLKVEIQPFEYTVKLDPRGAATKKTVNGKNVIAYLDNGAPNTLIIGAHYDHLGLNEHGNSTLMNSAGMIHHGADDNASGTSAVLELARIFTENRTREKVNIVFALFSGEEDGLMGSKHFAEDVKEKYPNVLAMVNMDMVGRLDEKKNLTMGGVGTSPIFPELVHQMIPGGLKPTLDESGIGPSDHTSFYLKDIPVLFLFTGSHPDYHKPSDTEEKINYAGISTITQYVFNLANGIADADEVPFTPTKAQANRNVADFKVTLGIMPSLADGDGGLAVDGVTEDRPAAKAGVKQGDVIIGIGKCKINDIYDYMDCLAEVKPGETQELKVKRDGKEIKLNATF